ncbi:MAG: sensor histidine kinase [Faecalicatena sp.]|uniref:sensor histidine kinase n=1 Tax=Faecalicatena sp. TaxID=2005360 RepID=UPI0025900A52|nr:sensor histidine kinase [Faecalicatena sp.]MCI6464339.1 sensor histidine kinase [Faecalicatena sp.]MDY5621314.1 sensor histidine kinase [Lachnospiraceae bacterium]
MLQKWSGCFKNHIIWFGMLICTDLLFSLFLWLQNPDAFWVLAGAMVFVSLCLFGISLWVVYRRDAKKESVFREVLEYSEEFEEEKLPRVFEGADKEIIRAAVEKLQMQAVENKEQARYIREYEDYMEAWAHEVKTPLALMTFVLDNRRDEMSAEAYQKLEYARNQLQEDISQVLYYAGLRSPHSDSLFERISLRECCQEGLTEYKVLLEEHQYAVKNEVEDLLVVSDRKGLSFMVSQAVSNSIKYTDPMKQKNELLLYTECSRDKKEISLHIRDNGMGVPAYDLPFLFDKGFTGKSHGYQKKATGMGLYLVKEMARKLKIEVDVHSEQGEGFEIIFRFADVD